MKLKVKKYLIKNKHLIEEDRWDEFYSKLRDDPDLYLRDVGDITKVLLDANINPLNHLSYIPAYFLYGQDVKSFNIPQHILGIEPFAFGSCHHLKDIYYEGKLSQWREFVKEVSFTYNTFAPDAVVHCVDGDISLDNGEE